MHQFRAKGSNQTAMSHIIASVVVLLTLPPPPAMATPDCSSLSPGCHILAYCEENAFGDSYCTCQQGTIDKSNGTGIDCDKNGFAVRYVVNERRATSWLSRPDDEVISSLCSAGTEGYYLRLMEIGHDSRDPHILMSGLNTLE
eukprot:135155-Rhodomonas_salina.1